MKPIRILLYLAIAFGACEKEPPPVIPFENEVIIQGREYEVRSASYFDGYYPFIGEDCVCLHLQFMQNGVNNGAGMTIELSKTLLGKRVSIAPSGTFWFFHIGTGRANVQLQNDMTPAKFGTRTGWFSVDYGDVTDEIIFQWELLDNNGMTEISRGQIKQVFERIENL